MVAAEDSAPIAELFRWATTDAGIDWQLGALLATAGLVGALATIYILLGQSLPLMGNATLVKRLTAQV